MTRIKRQNNKSKGCMAHTPPQATGSLVAFALRGLAGAPPHSPSVSTLLPVPMEPVAKVWAPPPLSQKSASRRLEETRDASQGLAYQKRSPNLMEMKVSPVKMKVKMETKIMTKKPILKMKTKICKT